MSLSDLSGLHLPIRELRSRGVLEDRVWWAVCTCGTEGPAVKEPGLATPALVEEHGWTEPAGCYVCGHVEPANGKWRQPWQRFVVTQIDGEWGVLCRRTSCRRQQLGLVAAAEEAATAAGVWDGEDFDPLRDDGERAPHFEVSLQTDFDDVLNSGLTSAVMNLLYARMNMPRSWVEITTSAHDRQALLAGVAALHAVSYTAGSSVRHWVLSARRAGATWHEIAAAIDFGTGEEFRRHFIDKEVEGYDWPLPLDGPVLGSLLAADVGDDTG